MSSPKSSTARGNGRAPTASSEIFGQTEVLWSPLCVIIGIAREGPELAQSSFSSSLPTSLRTAAKAKVQGSTLLISRYKVLHSQIHTIFCSAPALSIVLGPFTPPLKEALKPENHQLSTKH